MTTALPDARSSRRAHGVVGALTVVGPLLVVGDCIDDSRRSSARRTRRRSSGTKWRRHRRWAPSCAPSQPVTPVSWTRSWRIWLQRAWDRGAGPGQGPITVDLDSSVLETYGLRNAVEAIDLGIRRRKCRWSTRVKKIAKMSIEIRRADKEHVLPLRDTHRSVDVLDRTRSLKRRPL